MFFIILEREISLPLPSFASSMTHVRIEMKLQIDSETLIIECRAII